MAKPTDLKLRVTGAAVPPYRQGLLTARARAHTPPLPPTLRGWGRSATPHGRRAITLAPAFPPEGTGPSRADA